MPNTLALAKILWQYHQLNHALKRADCILVFGHLDTRVAEKAVAIFYQKLASYLIFTGGYGELTKNVFKKPEAEVFADIAIHLGVPINKIIIENKSTNTGENIIFALKKISQKKLNPQSFILVCKPGMERRVYATFKKICPQLNAIATSPKITFNQYIQEKQPDERAIGVLVGYTQRIIVYAKKGFQIPQLMPKKVFDAYTILREKGYTKHLIDEKF